MAKKEFTGVQITLPECRLSYPVLFEPKMNDLKGKTEWGVTMLFSKKTDISKLKQAMVLAAKNEFGSDVDLKTLDMRRIQDGDKPTTTGKERGAECEGTYVVKAATRLKQPGLVDDQVVKILDPTEIYSGVYAHVNVTVKAYGQPNRGVTIYLNHVQKTKDGEPFAGGPKIEDVFTEMDVDQSEVDAGAPVDDMEDMFGG